MRRDGSLRALQLLRYYKYEIDPNTGQFGRHPLHDHASHASDAARYIAVAMAEQRRASYKVPPKPPPRPLEPGRANLTWMRW